MIANMQCPSCNSDAVYSYGRTKNGKQRYLCLLCNRQFVVDRTEQEFRQRPACPLCGGKMHLYKREKTRIRFRCSAYPECRGYAVRAVQSTWNDSDAKALRL